MGTVVQIDRQKHLAAEPRTGHNRWHPSIPPVTTVRPGEQITLETRDGLDGQLTTESGHEDCAALDLGHRK